MATFREWLEAQGYSLRRLSNEREGETEVRKYITRGDRDYWEAISPGDVRQLYFQWANLFGTAGLIATGGVVPYHGQSYGYTGVTIGGVPYTQIGAIAASNGTSATGDIFETNKADIDAALKNEINNLSAAGVHVYNDPEYGWLAEVNEGFIKVHPFVEDDAFSKFLNFAMPLAIKAGMAIGFTTAAWQAAQAWGITTPPPAPPTPDPLSFTAYDAGATPAGAADLQAAVQQGAEQIASQAAQNVAQQSTEQAVTQTAQEVTTAAPDVSLPAAATPAEAAAHVINTAGSVDTILATASKALPMITGAASAATALYRKLNPLSPTGQTLTAEQQAQLQRQLQLTAAQQQAQNKNILLIGAIAAGIFLLAKPKGKSNATRSK